MKTYRFLAVFALALLMVVSTGQRSFGDPWEINQISRPGFGDVWNRYTYTQVYYEGDPSNHNDDAVYFGTYNQRSPASGVSYGDYDEVNGIEYGTGFPGSNVTKGGRIYKYHVSTDQWSLVWPNLDIGNFDPDEFGWRIAEVYDGKIYFGSYKSGWNSGARLMVIDPADDSVEFIVSGPTPWGSLVSIRALAVYNDVLYIGSERYFGGDLWSYDGTTLAHVDTFGGYNVAELEVYGGYLYIATWFPSSLYRTDGTFSGGDLNVTEVNIGSAADEEGVMTLEEFDGKFFVATADRGFSGGDGFSLFYYDNANDPDPTFITTNGFGGGGNNGYGWFLKTCGDLLFLGVFTGSGVDEGLWATGDGDNWTNLTSFYDPTPTEYGVRSLTCGIPADGIERLFYGTAANYTSPSAPRFSEATRNFRIEGPFTALTFPPAP